MKKKIGLIVNPIAGMGGSVGLKGTDGQMYEQAVALGSKPVAPARTKAFLSHVVRQTNVTFMAAAGKMGESYLDTLVDKVIVGGAVGEQTSSEDTRRIAREMLVHGVDLLVFAGGDGTARDIHDAVDLKAPVVGIPSGVKVYSSVFALSARAAAAMVNAFIEEQDVELVEEEVLDVDEDAFRNNILDARLYGYLHVPKFTRFLQGGKEASSAAGYVLENKKEIAEYMAELLEPDTLYLLGPGTTVKAIADEIDIDKTLLGVDAVINNHLVATDMNEASILQALESYKQRKIIVTPIGGNGFIFGRGNRQFTPTVIRHVGKENIIVVSTRDKLRQFNCLRVDTDDFELNRELTGYIDVITGYKYSKVIRLEC